MTACTRPNRPKRPERRAAFAALTILTTITAAGSMPARSGPSEPGTQASETSAIDRLIAAYPDQHLKQDGNDLVWPDGTRMPIDDGRGPKSFEAWIASPDLGDMLEQPYPAGTALTPPPKDHDPGRARNEPFFDKMYGDCRKNEVTPHLVTIPWLPKKHVGTLTITAVNGVAARLTEISNELDTLPAAFDKFLKPIGGTYNCRVIAGTDRRSAHGHGIAIDIAVKHTSYWRWADAKAGNDQTIAFKNEIPREIVDIFERHGFIWGGRWYHYDTMHFEYRPELFAPVPNAAVASPSPAAARAP